MDLSFLKKKDPKISGQIIRYFISGGTAFAFDFGSTVLLKETCNISATTAAIFGFGIGLIITYVLSITWIFDQRSMKSQAMEFVIFAAIGGIGIWLTYLLMNEFCNNFGIHYMIAKIMTTIIVTLWNFLAKKLLLFTKYKR